MPCATRSTKGPSTSVMAEPTEEASQDETSLHEESEPEQEVFTHNPPPNMYQPVYQHLYALHRGSRMDWMVNDALYHRFLKWKLKCDISYSVSSQPSQNAKSARKLSLGQVIMEWISMYPGDYPKKK